jgi:pilus assembly protein Flp/PilA
MPLRRSPVELRPLRSFLNGAFWFFSNPGVTQMTKLFSIIRNFSSNEDGATMVEYGLMLALIAVVCLSAVTTVGTGAQTMFNSIAASL